MIPDKFPDTYQGLCEFEDLFAESDEVFEIIWEYVNTRNENDKQTVIDQYQLSPEQVDFVERFNKLTDAMSAYADSLEKGEVVDLLQYGLNEAEMEFIIIGAAEGLVTEVVYRFSQDGNVKHLADFFKMFSKQILDIKVIKIGDRTIHATDVMQ